MTPNLPDLPKGPFFMLLTSKERCGAKLTIYRNSQVTLAYVFLIIYSLSICLGKVNYHHRSAPSNVECNEFLPFVSIILNALYMAVHLYIVSGEGNKRSFTG